MLQFNMLHWEKYIHLNRVVAKNANYLNHVIGNGLVKNYYKEPIVPLPELRISSNGKK